MTSDQLGGNIAEEAEEAEEAEGAEEENKKKEN